MPWPLTAPETIAAIKDLTLACAGAFTAWVASQGLGTWRRQLSGTADFDVARALAKHAYRVRDELQRCRSPWINGSEFGEEYHTHPGLKKPPEVEARGLATVYQKRWTPVVDALRDLDATTLEAEALWGSPVVKAVGELRQVLAEVNAAIDAMIRNAAGDGEDFKADRDFAKQIRSVVYGSPTDSSNKTNQKLADAIKSIDAVVRPHLRRIA